MDIHKDPNHVRRRRNLAAAHARKARLDLGQATMRGNTPEGNKQMLNAHRAAHRALCELKLMRREIEEAAVILRAQRWANEIRNAA